METWAPCPFGYEELYEVSSLGTDRLRDGTLLGQRKLTADIVRQCRLRYDGGRGERVAALAEEFGVALEHMCLVVTSKSWASVA
jgi:hypothetical protein